ncbi:STAS domain-containing protein [Paractinoplanes maris]|uniref:STAS domain-containing protein n=1 Tax=Paractinoplanes maris TaxID=1734446 RepID=UPI002021AD53|nr:STAS domain-containing protein [Actinoplanes maris]
MATGAVWQHEVTREGGTITVALTGELDLSMSERLRTLLTSEVRRPGTATVRADLTGVDFIDSSVVNAFVMAYHSAQDNGRRFVLTGSRGHVSRVLAVAGVLPTLSPRD